ncbi:hypothetical protein ACIPUD_37635, partial [Bradyrhizobium sp. CAR08]
MANDLSQRNGQMNQTTDSSFESKAKEALERAKLTGEWDFPLADAATDAAEMTYIDWAYWYYKLEKPTLKAENGVSEVLFLNDKSIVNLPDGFQKDTSVTLGAAGDLMPLDGIELSKNILFESIADVLFDVDISFANFEAP